MTEVDEVDALHLELIGLSHDERTLRLEGMPPDERRSLIVQLARRGKAYDPLASFFGARLLEHSDEHVVVVLPVRDHVRQPTGVVYATALVFIADLAATGLVAFNSSEPPLLAIDLHASFVSNQASGEVRAEARYVRRGRRVSVIRTQITGDDGKLLAEITSTHVPFEAPQQQGGSDA